MSFVLLWCYSYGNLQHEKLQSKSGFNFGNWCEQNGVDVNAIPLLRCMLTLDPKKRIKAEDAFMVRLFAGNGHCLAYIEVSGEPKAKRTGGCRRTTSEVRDATCCKLGLGCGQLFQAFAQRDYVDQIVPRHSVSWHKIASTTPMLLLLCRTRISTLSPGSVIPKPCQEFQIPMSGPPRRSDTSRMQHTPKDHLGRCRPPMVPMCLPTTTTISSSSRLMCLRGATLGMPGAHKRDHLSDMGVCLLIHHKGKGAWGLLGQAEGAILKGGEAGVVVTWEVAGLAGVVTWGPLQGRAWGVAGMGVLKGQAGMGDIMGDMQGVSRGVMAVVPRGIMGQGGMQVKGALVVMLGLGRMVAISKDRVATKGHSGRIPHPTDKEI